MASQLAMRDLRINPQAPRLIYRTATGNSGSPFPKILLPPDRLIELVNVVCRATNLVGQSPSGTVLVLRDPELTNDLIFAYGPARVGSASTLTNTGVSWHGSLVISKWAAIEAFMDGATVPGVYSMNLYAVWYDLSDLAGVNYSSPVG